MATYGDDLQSFLSWLGYESAQPGAHGEAAPGMGEPPGVQDPTVADQVLGQVAQNWQRTHPVASGAFDFLPPVALWDSVASLLAAPDLNTWMQQNQRAAPSTKTSKAGLGAQAPVSANAQIPMPWDAKYNVVSGNDFGQAVDPNSISGGYGPTHLGVDYGTPVGTQIDAPFAGTVHVFKGIKDYGNLVELDMANGWKLRFGHVADGAVRDGTIVRAGDPIAVSGQNVGRSRGAVTLVELMDPKGKLQNPHSILDPIFQGTTTPELTALLQQSAPSKYWTPDGQLIQAGTKLDQMYQMVNSIWKKEFGTNAPAYAARALEAAGVTNMEQVQAALNAMPSDIPGMNIGQRQALKTSANGFAMKLFNRPVPDSLLRQFAKEGRTDPVSVEEYFHSHPAKDMPAEDYQSIFDAASVWTKTWQDTPSPDQVFNFWSQAGGASPTPITPSAAGLGVPGLPVGNQPS